MGIETLKAGPLGAIPGSAEQRLRVMTGTMAPDPSAEDKDPNIIPGCCIAQLGNFKSEGRGCFDAKSLEMILNLASNAPNGLVCRFQHQNESNDGLGRELGRFKNFRMSVAGPRESFGQLKTDIVPCVRGDLHLLECSHNGPEGDLGGHIKRLSQEDPDMVSSSLVLTFEEEYQTDFAGRPLLDKNGEQLPPLWRPLRLHGCDAVAFGDAVDGLVGTGLSIDGLPNALVFQAEQGLNKHFAGKDRKFIEKHAGAYLQRYLDGRFGKKECSLEDWMKMAAEKYSAAEFARIDSLMISEDMPNAPTDGTQTASHDGCRSTLAYHHQTLCRQCGGTMLACGCDNVANESRVITMSKTPCDACLASPPPQADDDAQPSADDTPDAPPNADAPQGLNDRQRREREYASMDMVTL